MTQPRHKCLIVDDDVVVWQDILREFPAQAGCDISLAISLDAARSKIEREYFHTALVDLQLSNDPADASGLMILKWFRDLQEGTQAILITKHATIELGFDVASQYSGLGVASKVGFDAKRFTELFHSALQMAETARHQERGKKRDGEAQMLRGDRPIYLWEHDVLNAVGGDIHLIHTLLSLLIEPLAPITPPQSGNPSVIRPTEGLVHCSLWSRALGRPVKLVFGRKKEVEQFRASRPPTVQIVSERERSDMGGFAEIDAELEFSDFKSPLAAISSEPPSTLLSSKGRG